METEHCIQAISPNAVYEQSGELDKQLGLVYPTADGRFRAATNKRMHGCRPISRLFGTARAALVVIVVLGWTSPSSACDCSPYHSQVLPPEKLPDGSRFLAPTNTKVWVIETVELSSPGGHFLVLKHGDPELTHSVGEGRSPAAPKQTDCKLNFGYRVAMISPERLDPNQQYDVIRDFDHKTEAIGSFWTGSQRDVTPPVIQGSMACLGEDGGMPSDASCNLDRPAMSIQINADDDSTPNQLLLYRVQPVGYGASPTDIQDAFPVLALEPNHVRLSSGNVCRGATIRLPDPFEPGKLDITAMDLAGNQSQVRSCAIVGPRTYDVRKALERARGCAPPKLERYGDPQPWPSLAAPKKEEGKSARWWVFGLGTLSALLSGICFVLVQRLRQARK